MLQAFRLIWQCDRKSLLFKVFYTVCTSLLPLANLYILKVLVDSVTSYAGSGFEEFPQMLVGAGTVINLDQCKLAVECGAKFIVSPGYDEETVAWCCENGIAITPGCVTPTEIMMAKKHGLNVIKFFPANVYGGLKALKALAGPFPGTKFIPTGGVSNDNLAEFIASPLLLAAGGSWTVPLKEINAGNFDKITELCAEARKIVDEVRAK